MDLDIVRAGIPEIDDCPVLTRIKAFIVQEGVTPTLEHVFRDRQGVPIDLSPETVVSEASESAEESQDTVILRVKEFVGNHGGGKNKLHIIEGSVVTAAEGVVRAALKNEITGHAGLYQLSWAFVRDGAVKLINDGLLSVERSLFGTASFSSDVTNGPPTINEIRMQLMDSSAAENFLHDAVEFSDEQILLAIAKPIDYFNETLPPLGYKFTTANFPFRSHWLDATIGYLLQFAAHNYRRNRLGNASIDDKNKEAEYLRMSQIMLKDWKDFVLNKKVELNAKQGFGIIGGFHS